ncbi:hypothetical protein [Avibacterium paragallinarum]|uniref:hypothetical protein n=1 Tax=Avibacterium paragallinarum TaxID=728 RepID=UPI002EDA6DF9
MKKIVFFILISFILFFVKDKDIYLVFLGETSVYLSTSDILNGFEPNYKLNKGDVAKVNRLIDLKHYLVWEIKINNRMAYVLDGDYIIVGNE